tara:strand:+ start:6035 stop:6295 length:261 start_codon:yes stop_codon:yes gene_type:complete
MQKLINGIAILSGVVSITVVGAVGVVYLNKDAIIEKVKTEALNSIGGGLGGALTGGGLGEGLLPSTPSADEPTQIAPDAGFGVPNF